MEIAFVKEGGLRGRTTRFTLARITKHSTSHNWMKVGVSG
jgi:hypothetical protein